MLKKHNIALFLILLISCSKDTSDDYFPSVSIRINWTVTNNVTNVKTVYPNNIYDDNIQRSGVITESYPKIDLNYNQVKYIITSNTGKDSIELRYKYSFVKNKEDEYVINFDSLKVLKSSFLSSSSKVLLSGQRTFNNKNASFKQIEISCVK